LNAHAPPLDQSKGDKQTAPIELTFTRRLEGGFVGKRWVSPDLLETVVGGVEWIDEKIICDNLDGVAREVEARAATGEWSVSLGSPRQGLDPQEAHRHAAEFYADIPAWLFWLDIDRLRVPRRLSHADKLDEAADYVVSLMPEPFRNAGRIVLRTARTGEYPGLLSARVVFLLDEPRSLPEMKAVAKGLAALPEFGRKDHVVIDTGLYTPGHHVFISAPQCAPGVPDPGAKAGMFVKPGPPLDLDEAGHALGVDPGRTAARARTAGMQAGDERRALDVPGDQREGLLRNLVMTLPNDLERSKWIGCLHAIHGASGGAPYGRDIALEFSARWSSGDDDPQASALAYDTLPPGEKGIDYLTGWATNLGTPEALAAVAAIDQARRAALQFPDMTVADLARLTDDPIMIELNARYAFIVRHNGVLDLRPGRLDNGELRTPVMIPVSGFDLRYKNKLAPLGKRSKTWAQYWLAHPDRLEFDDIGCYPPNATPPGCLNMFEGFAIAPAPGQWPKTELFLRQIVCNGDPAAYDYLLKLLQWWLQNPCVLPEVSIVLLGPQGVGKGTFANDFLGGIIGERHTLRFGNPKALVADHNEDWAGKLLMFFDEVTFGHDLKASGILKSLDTEKTFRVNPKFVSAYHAPNRALKIYASNNPAALPIDHDDRRKLILDVSTARKEDTAYFESLRAAFAGGERAAFLHAALQADLTGFDRPEGLQDRREVRPRRHDRIPRDGVRSAHARQWLASRRRMGPEAWNERVDGGERRTLALRRSRGPDRRAVQRLPKLDRKPARRTLPLPSRVVQADQEGAGRSLHERAHPQAERSDQARVALPVRPPRQMPCCVRRPLRTAARMGGSFGVAFRPTFSRAGGRRARGLKSAWRPASVKFAHSPLSLLSHLGEAK
jgi:hypothetical protein